MAAKERKLEPSPYSPLPCHSRGKKDGPIFPFPVIPAEAGIQ